MNARLHLNNPYWDAIKDLHVDDLYGIRHGTYTPSSAQIERASSLYMARFDYCTKYAWSIPDPASVAFVAHYCTPIAVEMGAGTGYYAWMLTQMGVDMVCYDSAPPDIVATNHWCSPRKGRYEDFTGETVPTYHPVLQGTPEALQQHADRTLLLCWPPMSEMAVQCLEHYTGNRLVYIGEGEGGCTADDAFFTRLDDAWEECATHTPVQWDGIHDTITVYERRATEGATT